MFNNYSEVLENAREVLKGICNVCPECNGMACRGKIPGVGAKGSGNAFIRAWATFKGIELNMDACHRHFEADTSVELFGKKFAAPFFLAPIGGMKLNYGGILSEEEYSRASVLGALSEGLLSFTGDGPAEEYFSSTLPIIKEAGGIAIPTIKPWDQEKCKERIDEIKKSGAIAFAMDVDSAALVNLKLAGKPVYTKSFEELKELADYAGIPFIVKGVMTAKAALECQKAGVYGIVVSSHGGRVMEDCPATISVVREIRDAVGTELKILIDGGVRCGSDIFKCIAMGADAALIGRPFAIAIHGGREEGVRLLSEKLKAELAETMLMTDCRNLKEIDNTKIRR